MIRLWTNLSEVVQTFEQMDASESYIIARRTLACPTDRNHKSKQTTAGTPNQITPHTVVPLGVLNLEMDSSEWARSGMR